jgi:MFS family permease
MLPVVLLAMFMAGFDIWVVNVAALSLQRDLHVSDAALQLIVGGYAFMYASAALVVPPGTGASQAPARPGRRFRRLGERGPGFGAADPRSRRRLAGLDLDLHGRLRPRATAHAGLGAAADPPGR